MVREYLDGRSHYVIYGAESSYGTGTPVASNRFGKVQSISYTFNNNLQLGQGVGEGANATSINYGAFDVSGNITCNPTEFKFLAFGSGTVSGAGTSGDHYKILERHQIGYTGSYMKTALFEIGAKGIDNNKAYILTGISFNSWTLSGEQNGKLNCTVDFTAEQIKASTTISGYTSDGLKEISFNSGSLTWNSDTLSLSSFSVTCDFLSNYPKEVFTRLGKQPTKGVRRYTWTLNVNKHYDDAASTISATELMDEFFGATNHIKGTGTPTGRDMILTINEGSATGDRVIKIQLENSFINDWAENPSLEGGVVSVTVNGVSYAGDTNSGENVPVDWYTT